MPGGSSPAGHPVTRTSCPVSAASAAPAPAAAARRTTTARGAATARVTTAVTARAAPAALATAGPSAGPGHLRRAGGNCSVAELALKHLSTGTHTITAIYAGDATYSSNSGNPETLPQTVKQCEQRPDHNSAPHNGGGDDTC